MAVDHTPAAQPRLIRFVAAVVAIASIAFAATWAGLATRPDSVDPSAALITSEYWTAVATTGQIDEEDLGLFAANGTALALASDAPAGSTLNVRYNVSHVAGLDDFSCGFMEVRYRDSGAGARVIVRLKATNRSSGATSTILTFDSDAFPPDGEFQMQLVSHCAPGVFFGFSTHSYFLDVELRKTTGTGNPGFASVGIVTADS